MGPEFLIVTLIMLLGFGGTVLWVVALVEVARIPDHQFTAAGAQKVVWLLVVALAGWIGALIWWFSVRSNVRDAADRVPVGPGPPPGWYPDATTGASRWWDGYRWTDTTRP